MADPSRIDVWLFNVRFYKSRSLAADAVQGGLVHLNGTRVKPARAIKPGDVVSFRRRQRRLRVRGAVAAAATRPGARGPGLLPRVGDECGAARKARREHAHRRGLRSSPGHRPNGRNGAELRRLRGRD